MSQQNIDFGTFPDDPDADAIRTAFQKVQNNFNELYATATAGLVTSVNQSAGAGIQVNSPTGNVVVTANIACVQVSTSTLSIGQGGNGGTSAIISQTSQTLVIDINPANVFSNNFAANSSGGLANLTGTLTAAANTQPNLISAANLTTIGTLGNLTVTGNITGGNLVSANFLTGTLTTNAQSNITSVGTLTSLNVTGTVTASAFTANTGMFTGDGGGLSNLNISAGSSIISGSSNVRIISSGGNVVTSVAGNADIIIATGTGVNVNGYLTSSGNITSVNANLGNAATASYFIGSGNNLSNIQGANVSGTVANATYAASAGSATSATSSTTAATVTTNAQPNITSVGTLTSLDANGTITAVAFTANTGVFTGNGNGLTNIVGANVTGTVANATYAVSSGSATTAGTVTTNAQPNITSVGTLSSLTITGNVTAGNVYANTGTIGAQYLKGDGSNITNITVGAGSSIVNGTSNVIIYNNSNVTTSVAGNANIVTVTGTGVNIAGTLNATGTISGNLSGNFSGNVTTAAQGNITSLGPLTGLTVNGLSNLGPVGNVTITGGSSNFYLRTNGSGVLTWSDALLTPIPGSNTQVLFNDAGTANASSSLTFNKTTGLLTATTLGGNLSTAAQPNITSVGTLTSLIVNGNINSANVSGGNLVSANYFTGTLTTAAQPNITSIGTLTGLTIGNATANSVFGNGTITLNAGLITGNGAGLSQLAGGNVTGTVANATYAVSAGSTITAGTVTTAAQPNITSTGTLTSLIVSGNISAGNISATNHTGTTSNITGQYITTLATGTAPLAITSTTRVANLNVAYSNVADYVGTGVASSGNFNITLQSGTTGNIQPLGNTAFIANASNGALYATTFVGALSGAATTAGTVTTAAQPNITSTGTLTSLAVTGNISAGNVSATTFTGALSGAATSATTAGTVTTAAQPNITSVGTLTSLSVSGNATVGNVSATNHTGTTANITGQYITTVATGTAPFVVTSTTQVANLSVATAGTVTTAAQPNITSVGTLTSLAVTGNISAGNVSATTFTGALSGAATSATTAGTVTTAAQPNITSVGTLTTLSSGNITTTGYAFVSVGTGIAAAGTVQGNATVISKQINVVSTVATGAGVVLPTAVAGMTIYITNTTANSLLVYPASGGVINSLATNAAITQAANSTLHYIAPTTTQWYSVGATYA
jgi:hypothetical protein